MIFRPSGHYQLSRVSQDQRHAARPEICETAVPEFAESLSRISEIRIELAALILLGPDRDQRAAHIVFFG